jgi:hypothetical protein
MGEQGTSDSEGLFTAFRQERVSNRRWLWVIAIPLFGVVAGWLSTVGRAEGMQIVTPTGIKLVTVGMAQQEVLGMLGRPISKETRADGAECFRHGMFSMNEPSTTVYVLCYVGGQLKDISTRRYSLWEIDPSGAFVPAGEKAGEAPAPQKAAPPATP